MKIIFTCGDINGIGSEINIKAINRIKKNLNTKIVFLSPKNVFEDTTKIVGAKFKFDFIKNINEIDDNSEIVSIFDLGNAKQNIGKPTITSGKIAYKAISLSIEMLQNKIADAVVTAPISKTAFGLAKIPYPGHTELYAKKTNTKNYVMMFLSNEMNAALITIHQPIKSIPKLITKNLLESKINTIINVIKNDLLISNPKIAILGLNPHAGENGIIGDEEQKIVIPVIKNFSPFVEGPFSADAFFGNQLQKKYNVVVGMYHDQILIPFKLINFYWGVNYTAGLPIVRTSPDHGVAYDIAGTNKADETSTYQAFLYAYKIAQNRKKNFVSSKNILNKKSLIKVSKN